MKVSVKVHGSSGSMFGGSGQTVETKIEVDEEAFDHEALMRVTHTLGVTAGMIVRDIEHRAEPEPDAEPDEDSPEDGYAEPEEKGDPKRPEHPALPEVRKALDGAVLTFDEAQEIRNLALAGQRRHEDGLTDGR
ncbi:hypothetical protein QDA03_gp48 [Microbacterium phage Terij]|uniref:Uncharacterized protein n=1 Tax=Microbacterium phage Terij TaxID=2686229 RepID=A0A6B9L942_9CAUD|nr:hypothetical protein QDA03_gp48 [Microbacterium phage Terij]QHB37193.1 hypothetical protein SEA_TERIJ_59 [Microbacterium phage Terij]